ncbi:CRISPR-associated endonuclease Cas2 [Micromonospora rosaria]|uniref:CRISPR-associated endonuclease Cas2 n=1 Tax=Micromonospora rosaria TaxID=47874 RepID=UPI000AC6A9AB|nr:CRISPR-associated endonuclease Cas2 [Micromonospora rosaria]
MSTEDVRRFLVAYDVTYDIRRTKVTKKLESYGDRVQYSVFIVDARPAQLLRLRTQLADLIDQSKDSVVFCDLGAPRENQRRSLDFVAAAVPSLGTGRRSCSTLAKAPS